MTRYTELSERGNDGKSLFNGFIISHPSGKRERERVRGDRERSTNNYKFQCCWSSDWLMGVGKIEQSTTPTHQCGDITHTNSNNKYEPCKPDSFIQYSIQTLFFSSLFLRRCRVNRKRRGKEKQQRGTKRDRTIESLTFMHSCIQNVALCRNQLTRKKKFCVVNFFSYCARGGRISQWRK